MRKHLLRFLLIVMIVCFGVGIIAACGDDTEGENPNPDEATTYTLTYKANGGVGNDKTEQHKEGDTVTVLGADTFSRDGYTFTKWKEEGGSAEYNAGATFTMPARNVTLAAQWQTNGSTEAEYEIKVTDPTGKAHVEFDKEGPYHKGDVVRFTVDFAPGENLRVVSVKADGVELQKGEDGKYTVTVAEKDIEITIESEPMGEHEFNVSLSVTGGGNGNSATLDKEGTVGKDEKVTLTVVTAEGYTAEVKLNGSKIDLTAEGKYELTVTEDAAFTVVFTKNSTETQEYTVSLNVTGEGNGNSATLDKSGKVAKDTKVTLTVVTAEGYTAEVKLNGNKVNLTAEGKYEHTVTADAAFTVTFTKNDEPGPGPSAKDLTTFHNAGMSADGNDIQLVLRFNATGYANANELKGDLKVAVGAVEVAPYQVDFSADGANTAYFHIPVADLTIESGSSAQVTLKSTAAAKTYDVPATSVDAQNTAVFGGDTYTLAYEGEKLLLKCTKQSVTPPQPGDKALSDFGVSDIITFGDQGVRIVLRFKATGYDTETIKSDITIKINNVSIAAQEVGGNAAGYDVYFLLKPEDIAKLGNEPGKITLVAGEEEYTLISNGTIGQNNAEFGGRKFTLSVAENELTLTVAATSTESTVNVTVTGKPADVQGEGYELKNGDDAVTSGGKVPTTATLTLTVTVPEGYKATVKVDGATLVAGGNNTYTINSLTATVTITITYAEEGEEGEQEVTGFADVSIAPEGDGFAIAVRVQTNGFADNDAIKNGLKLTVGELTLDAARMDDGNFKILFFAVTKEQALALTGDVAVVLQCGTHSYEKPYSVLSGGQFKVDLEGKTFTLTEKEGELYLAVSEGSAPDPTVKSLNIAGGDIVLENESIYFVINGTYTQYSEAEVKALLLTYHFDMQKLSGAVSGNPEDWSVQTRVPLETLEENITVQEGTWRVRYDISELDSYAYAAHFSPDAQPGDLKKPAEDGKELEFGGRKYTLHYTENGNNQVAYWGCIGLRIESLSGPVKLETPSISVDGKNLTITDGNEKGVKEYRIGVFNSDGLQLRTYTLAEKTGTIDDTRLQDGAYTLKVMAVPSSADYLDSDWSVATDYTVSNGKFEYDLNYGGEGGMAYDEWIWWTEQSENVIQGESKYSGGVVTFTFHKNTNGPEFHYATQLFYKSTALKQGDAYTLTLKITSTKSGKITINGTVVDLVENVEKSVTVSELTQGADSTVSIQCAAWGEQEGTCIAEATFTIKEVQIEKTSRPEPEKPTFTFVKGEGAEGEDPRLEAEDPNDRGSYTVNLPQNPYTAPEGKYFRGWQINDVVYFPEEAYDAEAGATITVTAVWEDLYAEFNADQSVIGVWGSSAGAELKIVEGKTTKAVVTYSALDADGDGSTAYAGINVQVIKNSTQFYFLRTDVEAALITDNDWVNGKWRDASGELQVNPQWAITTYTDNQGTTITADAWLAAKLAGKTVIEITLTDNTLTVKETYYTDKTGDTVYVTFTYTMSGMTEKSYSVFLAAQQGTTVETATVTSHVQLSDQQSASVEEPLTWNASKAYVNNIWHTEIRKGEKLELSGTVKFDRVSDQGAFAPAVWDGPVLSLYTNAPLERMRVDNYVLDGTGSATAGWDTKNGLHCVNAQSGTGSYSQYVESREYNFKVTLDWTGDSIVYTIVIGDNLVVSTWTVTAKSGALQDSYFACFGGDNAVMTFTSMTRSHAAQA